MWECRIERPESLKAREVALTYRCVPQDGVVIEVGGVDKVAEVVEEVVARLRDHLNLSKLGRPTFMDNEPIGTKYVIYRFRAGVSDTSGGYVSCRAITENNKLLFVLCTVGEEILKLKGLTH